MRNYTLVVFSLARSPARVRHSIKHASTPPAHKAASFVQEAGCSSLGRLGSLPSASYYPILQFFVSSIAFPYSGTLIFPNNRNLSCTHCGLPHKSDVPDLSSFNLSGSFSSHWRCDRPVPLPRTSQQITMQFEGGKDVGQVGFP